MQSRTQITNTITTIGIMTGNSLDAVDCVLTEFNGNKIKDIAFHSKPYPQDLVREFLALKLLLQNNGGNTQNLNVDKLHDKYINLVAETVKELINIAITNHKPQTTNHINLIGFHGQTCYHLPPSIAKSKKDVKTIQLGSGQMLANLTGIPVAYDFRSDDIFNGGEGAPFAPMHNLHLAQNLKLDSVAFLNAGNTGNIAIVSPSSPLRGEDTNSCQLAGLEFVGEGEKLNVIGFDVGPCNHLIDKLCREVKDIPCDFDGRYGKKGKINQEFLNLLLEQSAITQKGENFYHKAPPKSSDPAWYKLPDMDIKFEDKIRTLEHFSAYLFVDALKFSKHQPDHFLLFGGGWNNPVILKEFKKLISSSPLRGEDTNSCQLAGSEFVGEGVKPKIQLLKNSQYLEARIFADAARCKLQNIPFTLPQTTGCKTPTICGIIAKPDGKDTSIWSRASI